MANVPPHDSAPQFAISTLLNGPKSLVRRILLFVTVKHDALCAVRPLDGLHNVALRRAAARAGLEWWCMDISLAGISAAGALPAARGAMLDRHPGRLARIGRSEAAKFPVLDVAAAAQTRLRSGASSIYH